MKRLAVVCALAALASPILASSASAQDAPVPDGQWQVCNQTSFVLRVATAIPDGGALAVRGWRRANPGACLLYPVPGPNERFVLAESDPAHSGGVREWRGPVELCAGADDFEATTARSCALQNLGERGFMRVATDERRTLLVEPEGYGERAEAAGVQRLLRDAGYRVRRIDGLQGRGTTRTLTQFRRDRGLGSNTRGDALFGALREAAMERRAQTGLEFCNDSEERIWGAVALRRDGEWQSRGWWPVEAGTCERVVSEPLAGLSAHAFALQEDTTQPPRDPDDPEPEAPVVNPDRRLRASAASPAQFCITEGSFSALGRDQCRDRGYVAVNFRALPEDEEGITLRLDDADFVAPSTTGLRR